MTLWYQTYDRIDTFETSQEKLDCLHELLAMDGVPEVVRDELRTFIGNILIHDHLESKYPIPIKPKKPRAPRKKKPTVDPVVVESSVVSAEDQV